MYIKAMFLVIFLSLSMLNRCFSSSKPDYIIVGAGSAGATLASRLSEDPSINVLLIEAGEKAPNGTENRSLALMFESGTRINWNYTIESDGNSCHGAINKTCPYFMGKTLGGSSQINLMLYFRGNHKDYDLWAENGADGWSYKDVLPYFIKAEGITISPKFIDEAYHGKNGPLTVSSLSGTNTTVNTFTNAAKELGFKILDYNGKSQKGFGLNQLTMRNGLRCSTEKAYLQPAYSRQNLQIITGALVTKVIITELKKATGVIYLKDGELHTVKTKREVILSAGAIKSPQLLMLSGIGPKKHLDKFQIKVLSDLPVGKNLQDHVGSISLTYTHSAIQENINVILGFTKSPYETIHGDYNDLQYFLAPSLRSQRYFNQELASYLAKFANTTVLTVTIAVLHPKSKGFIELKSPNPTSAPRIIMNFYKDPQDLQVLLHGIKVAKKMIETTKAFSKLNVKLVGPIPGCKHHPFKSDDYFMCVGRTTTESLYHACGSCKMGQFHDKSTVVDTSLRVKEIHGLRVVDASIMPRIVSGNTNAPTIMIAEKAADIIKKEFRESFNQ